MVVSKCIGFYFVTYTYMYPGLIILPFFKSTLLHALIGDVSSSESSDITMRGSVAYASQSPFILNATLRDNILFGLDYKKDLYDRVLEACNLLPDLEQLGQARDLTEIGERGVTLSGGMYIGLMALALALIVLLTNTLLYI